MVDGDDIIPSQITHRHHRRLYHKFSICARTNEYLFNMPFIVHSVFNVYMGEGDEEYLPRNVDNNNDDDDDDDRLSDFDK